MKNFQSYFMTLEDYLKMYDSQQYEHAIAALNKELESLKSTSSPTDDDKKKIAKIEKTLKGASKKNLSPSYGVHMGVVVRDTQGELQVYLMTFADARGRGCRFNVNGGADIKIDNHDKHTIMREVREETMRDPNLALHVNGLERVEFDELPFIEIDKTGADRFAQCKFLYYSRVYFYVDTSKVFTEDELARLIADANITVNRLQMHSEAMIGLRFYNPKKDPNGEEFAKLLHSARSSLVEYTKWRNEDNSLCPFTNEEFDRLTHALTGDNIGLSTLQDELEESIMNYTESNQFGFIGWKQLIAHPEITSVVEGKKELFEPNAEALRNTPSEIREQIERYFERCIQQAKSASATVTPAMAIVKSQQRTAKADASFMRSSSEESPKNVK